MRAEAQRGGDFGRPIESEDKLVYLSITPPGTSTQSHRSGGTSGECAAQSPCA
jgi:hypothetical protein